MQGSLATFFLITYASPADFLVDISIKPALQKFSSLTGIIVLHLWHDELEIDFFSPSLEKSIFLFLVFFPAS